MTSCSALVKVAASFLLWAVIGIEGNHDSCKLQAGIRCQVPGTGWSDCKDIRYDPAVGCENISVSFMFQVCNQPSTGTASFLKFKTTINNDNKFHKDQRGMSLAPHECATKRVDSVIDTCRENNNWAMLKTKSITHSDVECTGFAFWRMVIPTMPPTKSPTFPPCDLDVFVSCNRRDKPDWPNCNTIVDTSPETCGKIPVSIRTRVCNNNNPQNIDLLRGVTSVNAKESNMHERYKVTLAPNECVNVKTFDIIDTCTYELQWAWSKMHGQTLYGKECRGYDNWEQYIPYITRTPTVAPTIDPCEIHANVTCSIVGTRTSNWNSCDTLVKIPNQCDVVPVSLMFEVCNGEVLDGTDIVAASGNINGTGTTLDLFRSTHLNAGGCIVQRKRAYWHLCNNNHFYSWLNVQGDGGCSDYAMWSHTLP